MKRPSPGLVLAISVIGISFAGPLTRLSNAEPLAIAVWRLSFSLLVVAAAIVITGQWRDWQRLTIRDSALAIVSGLALALHFWAWIASIQLTTIAASVTLVSLQPAFVIGISAMFLKEFPTRRQIIGIGIAVIGAFIIASPALRESGSTLAGPAMLGNLLATSAAVTAAIYYSIGRSLRARYGIWAYVGLCYSACTIGLLIAAFSTGAHLGNQPPRELAIFAGLAIGPMLLGHTGMNWALKYLPAYVVNLTVLGEPVGATLLGAVIPAIAQLPSFVTLAGGLVVLAGVAVAAAVSPFRSSH